MFDKKKIGIGIDDFKSVIEKNYYFVDKSKLIEDIIADGAIVKLFCRPRRFGKTLNMSMMKYFFDIREKEENRKLFDGLYIENSPMIEEQGKYPVIFLTLKEIKGNNIESMYTQIKTLISDLFNQYEYLRENLNERDIEIFDNLWKRKDEDYSNSLKFLIECLNNYYKQKVILLIDEYDTPLLTAHEFGYYNEALQFFKTFYGGALKSNVNLQMGVLTGIIRVAQAGIFSDLNNFYSNTILENEYSQYFGLLEAEVENMLKYYEIEYKIDNVKEWYNGYTFGKVQVYNPWSILHFVRTKELKPFWVNTSSNYLIREILRKSGRDIFDSLEKLFNQEEIRVRINPNVEVHSNLNANEIFSLMLYSGYLTIKKEIADNVFTIRIPNKEIISFFHNTFIEIIFKDSIDIDDVKFSLIDRDLKGFEKAFSKLIAQYLSSYDISSPYENPYHMFLLGFFTSMRSDYIVNSNQESGYGRPDIVLRPLNKTKTGYIMELKAVKKGESIEKKLEEAKKQLIETYYEADLEKNGIKDIVKIAIVFEGKRVEFKYVD
ncbi:Predicted AAA-ATPase [Fusobacterium necrogenes]|uniref:Predicted AAA-ATPase n=1 Tax=Fusobacterium necrogenes TaxID=858 RepID=A0A377GW57_9FUSO|nr:AAA family ATPase [Fusobacterium necrogenes]STO31230.1 Predicted AAA-ATPase [Fusobacterium necrogenes]